MGTFLTLAGMFSPSYIKIRALVSKFTNFNIKNVFGFGPILTKFSECFSHTSPHVFTKLHQNPTISTPAVWENVISKSSVCPSVWFNWMYFTGVMSDRLDILTRLIFYEILQNKSWKKNIFFKNVEMGAKKIKNKQLLYQKNCLFELNQNWSA